VPLVSNEDTSEDNVFWTEVEFAEKNLTVMARFRVVFQGLCFRV
jgi:hypothetical protein